MLQKVYFPYPVVGKRLLFVYNQYILSFSLSMFSSLKKHHDVALLLMRLAVAAVFIYHGMGKWSMESPNTVFTILKWVEPIGGIAILLGVLSQLAALGLSIIMIGAIYAKATSFYTAPMNLLGTFGAPAGMSWNYDLTILALCVSLLIMGAGKYSIEGMMKK